MTKNQTNRINLGECEVGIVIAKRGIRWPIIHGEIIIDPLSLELLALVAELGSLNKAKKHLGMGYNSAWQVIKRSEKNLGLTLLDSKSGSGSVLTPDAREILDAYRSCAKRAGKCLISRANAL